MGKRSVREVAASPKPLPRSEMERGSLFVRSFELFSRRELFDISEGLRGNL